MFQILKKQDKKTLPEELGFLDVIRKFRKLQFNNDPFLESVDENVQNTMFYKIIKKDFIANFGTNK